MLCVERVASVSSNTILGQNMINRLYDYITRVRNTYFTNLIHQGFINAIFDMFCARNCSDVLHHFTGKIAENILYDVCVD